jgi:programmed cell death 6-interacting protein
MADSDDVEGRIMKAAAGFEKLAELHPAMFEDIMDEELAKYDRYLVEMDEQRKRVEEALMEIKVCMLLCILAFPD